MRLNRLSPVSPAPRQGGFTLLELLIAMSIFLVIGVALVALVARAFDFLRAGASAIETADAAAAFSDSFEEDVDTIFATRARIEGVRLLSYLQKWPVSDVGASGRKVDFEVDVQVFGFVRTIKGEETERLYRLMGERPGAEAYLDGTNDETEGVEGKLRAGGGLMEVLYLAVPDVDSGGMTSTLYRAFRAPIGGPKSLLRVGAIPDRETLEEVARPVIGGVLHFDVRFWDATIGDGDGYGEEPLRIWDSTRGLLEPEGDTNAFALAVGPESVADTRDDVFPRRIRATLTIAGVGRQAERARLAAPLEPRGRSLELDRTGLVPAVLAPEHKYLKVGAEWVRFAGRDGSTGFVGLLRGERGTPVREHPAGEPVYHGRTVVFDHAVQSFREDPATTR